MTSKMLDINLADFNYILPPERIAETPLDKRDDAKLLVYVKGEVAHSHFYKLHNFLAKQTLVVFNDTKVIPARLYFKRKTGALIEIFLLQPESPRLVSEAMISTEKCVWRCLIGNKKRWKNEILSQKLTIGEIETTLFVKMIDEEKSTVELSWDNATLSFSDIIHAYGELPLPPYIKRKATSKDEIQYQTVYSAQKGAVASPTAGLHFTEKVFENLEKKGIYKEFITLHVSGGTFQPIKTEKIIEHAMHSEQIIFTQVQIAHILQHIQQIVAVGTTSMRALESLYWFGVKLFFREQQNTPLFFIEKLYSYQHHITVLPSPKEALEAILEMMQKHHIQALSGETEIFIFPGYQFKMCKGLITNFHLPNTTLILLVAAFIGEDWRKVYEEALTNEYRFLSYGDSSLLLP